MDEIKLTAAQTAEEIGESVHVLRNWIKEFRSYIPIAKSDNGYNLFTQESINVLLRIKQMYRDQHLTTRQIDALLSGADRPTVQTAETAAAAESIDAVRELLQEQRDFNQALLLRLDQQHAQMEQFVTRRDEQIMYVLRELQQAREQRQLETKSLPWYKRIGRRK